MSRERYLERQLADPQYVAAQAVAHAQIELADALYRRRVSRRLDPDETAARAGIREERLGMIEEGDASPLPEILQLLRVLDLTVTIEPELRLTAAPPDEMRSDATQRDRPVAATASPAQT